MRTNDTSSSPVISPTKPPSRALTVIQPWATLLATGMKRYETRSWATRSLGQLAIHAGRRTKQSDLYVRDLIDMAPDIFEAIGVEDADDLPYGAIIATGWLTACLATDGLPVDELEAALGDFSPGRFAWRMDRVTLLAVPIQCKGAQGLWDVPAGLLEGAGA